MIKRIRAAFAAFFVAGTIFAGAPAWAVPAICVMPTTGTVSGLSLVQDVNNCLGAALALFAGGTAPATPPAGMLWWNTGTGWVQQWDGAAWVNLWFVDSTNHLIDQPVGGGSTVLASAATTDLCANPANDVQISGSAAITSFGSSCTLGQWKSFFINGGAPTLVQSGSLLLPNNGNNIVAASGDTGFAVYLGSGVWVVKSYQRATGAALSTFGLNVGAPALGNSALAFTVPVNLGITASAPSGQLTVNLTGANGAVPSPGNPVLIPFRSTTSATGTPTTDSLQSSLGVVFSATSSLGCTTAVLCRIWVYAIDNGGAAVIGLQTCSSPTQIYSCSDDLLYSTASGTTGGTALNTMYASTGSLSNKAVRIVGYIEATWTSGTGFATPTKLQLFGPGVKKPGDLVQTLFTSATSGSTTNSSTPAVAYSLAITPTSAVNLVHIQATIFGTTNTASATQLISQVYRGATPLWTDLQIGDSSVNGEILGSNTFNLLDAPGAATSQTYAIEVARGGAAGVTYNAGSILLMEIMGALDLEMMLPANDTGAPLRLVG